MLLRHKLRREKLAARQQKTATNHKGIVPGTEVLSPALTLVQDYINSTDTLSWILLFFFIFCKIKCSAAPALERE